MAHLELDGRITEVNEAFAALLDVPAPELAGRELLEFVHPDDEKAIRHGRLTSFRAGTVEADLRIERADGSSRWARLAMSLARDLDGTPLFLVATLVDIADLKSSEASLRRHLLYDPETDLPTHRLLEERLDAALAQSQRTGEPVLVGAVRLRPETEIVIASERLAGAVRTSDTVARLGHREFAVVMPGASPEAFERILAGQDLAAAGLAVNPDDGDSPAALLAAAQTRAAAGPLDPADDPEAADVAARVQALQPVSVFLTASNQVLGRLARYTSRQTARAGEEITLDWNRPSLRVVEDGLLEVIPDGQEAAVMTLAPSDFIGTDQHEERVTVRVRAVTETRVLVLGHDALEEVAPVGSALRSSIRDALQRRSLQVRRMSERLAQPQSHDQLRVAVYSTKGGSGRTTFATNLAAELAAGHPGEVLLIDLSLPFNHVALVSNLAPTTCLARLSGLEPWALGGALRGALAGHPDGFMVLPSALRPEEADLVGADLVAAAIEHLSPQFRFVVYDLGTPLNDMAISVLDRSDRLVVIATPELTSMHDTRAFLEIATNALHLPTGAIDVVLNHRAPHAAMDARAVEEVLGRPLAAEFGYMGARPEKSVLAGALMVRQGQPSPLSEGIAAFAQRLTELRTRTSA